MDITNITPTMRRQATMVKAIKIIITASMAFVGRPRERAKFLSNATAIIARYITTVNIICATAIMANVIIFLSVIVSMLPKR